MIPNLRIRRIDTSVVLLPLSLLSGLCSYVLVKKYHRCEFDFQIFNNDVQINENVTTNEVNSRVLSEMGGIQDTKKPYLLKAIQVLSKQVEDQQVVINSVANATVGRL